MSQEIAADIVMRDKPSICFAHPNDLDRKRIERGLKARRRYRYVEPKVSPIEGGYRIECPCCSRNIDPDGGIVDIAQIIFDDVERLWNLFRKNHAAHIWELNSTHARLVDLLAELNADPERKFWQ